MRARLDHPRLADDRLTQSVPSGARSVLGAYNLIASTLPTGVLGIRFWAAAAAVSRE